MLKLVRLGLACVALLVTTPAFANEYLAVVNRGTRDIALISIPDHRVVATIPIDPKGKVDDVVASPDGEVLFANIQYDVDEKPGAKPRGEIVALSTRTGERLWTTKVDGIPHHLAISLNGQELFVPLFDRQRMEVLDTKTGAIAGAMYARPGMHTTRLSVDGKLLYAGSIFTGQIYAFDVATRKLVHTNTVSPGEFGGIAVRPFAVTKDGSTMFVQLSGFHGVATLKAGQEVASLFRYNDLPKGYEYPEYPYNVDHGLELSPDEKTLVTVSEATQKAYVFSVSPMKLKKTISIGRIPKWVSFSGNGEFAYASNAGDGTVSVISMKSLTEVARIDTGGVGGTIMRVLNLPEGNVAALPKKK